MARARTRKTSKTRQDIFTPTRPGGRPLQGRRPGRPPVHDEAWTKVTVVLFNRQIVFLDRLGGYSIFGIDPGDAVLLVLLSLGRQL